MSTTPLPGNVPLRSLIGITLVCLAGSSELAADDRFFVPVAPSSSSPPSPPPASSDSGSSGGSAAPSGNTTSSTPSGSNPGGRFFVPMPSANAGGGGGGHGGGGMPGEDFQDPYWGGCYFSDGFYHYWDGPGMWRYAYPQLGYTVMITRTARPSLAATGPLVFFPPETPPLGYPLPTVSIHGERLEAPAALHAFITSPFYPQLSSRLRRGNLSPRQLREVEAYRSTRRALLAELREAIVRTRTLPQPARDTEFATLAHHQGARLEALERQGESLRTDLLRGGLLAVMGESGDWNQGRTWRLGSPELGGTREQTLRLEFRVLRAAAFYQDGLSPEQRRLLREVAADLQAEAYPSDATHTTDAESLVYFSPATTRMHFSSDLPAAVKARIAAYTAERESIKAELRDVLYTHDAESNRARTKALRQLAAAHEPRLAALEATAEGIRRELTALGRAWRPAPLPLPDPDLAARLAVHRAHRAELQRALDGELARASARIAPSAAEGASTLQQAIDDFAQAHAHEYDALDESSRALRADLATFYQAAPRHVSTSTIEAIVRAVDEANTPDALWQRYSDYADAALLPGLSLTQRTLLLDGALENLDIPLPDAERMP